MAAIVPYTVHPLPEAAKAISSAPCIGGATPLRTSFAAAQSAACLGPATPAVAHSLLRPQMSASPASSPSGRLVACVGASDGVPCGQLLHDHSRRDASPHSLRSATALMRGGASSALPATASSAHCKSGILRVGQHSPLPSARDMLTGNRVAVERRVSRQEMADTGHLMMQPDGDPVKLASYQADGMTQEHSYPSSPHAPIDAPIWNGAHNVPLAAGHAPGCGSHCQPAGWPPVHFGRPPHGAGPPPLPDDRAGVYVVMHHEALVSPTIARTGASEAVVALLPAGTFIHVLEVQFHSESGRLRGRIEHPPGWISLLNLETGYRWAGRQGDLPNPTWHEGPWQQSCGPCGAHPHHDAVPLHGPVFPHGLHPPHGPCLPPWEVHGPLPPAHGRFPPDWQPPHPWAMQPPFAVAPPYHSEWQERRIADLEAQAAHVGNAAMMGHAWKDQRIAELERAAAGHDIKDWRIAELEAQLAHMQGASCRMAPTPGLACGYLDPSKPDVLYC